MPLTILSASAGSGKTYRLSREFVASCLVHEDASYSGSLLAMTFTNKATAEMKERILHLLKSIMDGESKIYPGDPLFPVLESLGHDLMKIRAEHVLKYLLKNYHNFNVSTLDSFFQSIIRQFQRELSLDNPYKVELNYDEVLKNSIAYLLNQLESGSPEFKWLLDWITDNLQDGKNWDVRMELESLGRELLKEEVTESWQPIEIETLEDAYQHMRSFIDSIDKQFKENQEALRKILQTYELNGDDFLYAKASFINTWLSKKNIFDLNGKRFLEDADDIKNWCKSTAPGNIFQAIESCYEPISLLRSKILELQNDHRAQYKSYKAVLRYFRNYVALRFLHKALQSYCRQNDILLLSEANRLVSRVISGSDMSLLYEKSGQRYLQLMVDEFQDTSVSQWNNIRPLIENSLAEDKSSLLVGDIKQAIYRWRNGDWRLMHHQVEADIFQFASMIQNESLDKNWRSSAAIVNFNNGLFSKAVPQLSEVFLADVMPHPLIEAIQEIYADVNQNITKSESEDGSVVVTVLPAEAEQEEESDEKFFLEKQWLNEQLKQFFEQGYKPSDIAILVRGHFEAAQIMVWMDEWDISDTQEGRFKAVSEKGYLMKNNDAIQFLVYALRHRIEPSQRAIRANVLYFWQRLQGLKEVSKPFWNPEAPQQLPSELNLIRDSQLMSLSQWMSMLIKELELQPDEPAFLSAFLDLVREFELKQGNEPYGFPDWWASRVENTGIPSNQSLEAIQVMTIHKAKGLQFPVVLIPFTNGKLVNTRNMGELIYVTHDEDPVLSILGKVPVSMSKSALEESWFFENWKEEYIMKAIDTLNMLYVATTRAEQHLRIAVLEQTPNSKGILEMKTIGDLLQNSWPDNSHCSGIQVVYGNPLASPWKSNTSDTFETFDVPNLSIRNSGLRTGVWLDRDLPFDEAESTDNARSRGIIMHEALARMQDFTEIERVLIGLKEEGILSENQHESTKLQLQEFISNPEVRDWFQPTQSFYAEREIIEVDGKSYRPDRVLVFPNKTVLIDFKTGSPHAKYQKQLKQYVTLLGKMGLPPVEAYLAYISPVHIEKLSL
jgi:ATP-dependent helicase/nuclease subunit A